LVRVALASALAGTTPCRAIEVLDHGERFTNRETNEVFIYNSREQDDAEADRVDARRLPIAERENHVMSNRITYEIDARHSAENGRVRAQIVTGATVIAFLAIVGTIAVKWIESLKK
jgi:hypothetical protein